MMQKEEIERFIDNLGFRLINGTTERWCNKNKGYKIEIDLEGTDSKKWKIDYGEKIKVHRRTTSNFKQKENLVVLECVCRLLSKGYPPDRIELEKKWRVGGYLDIFVKDEEGKAYLMVECKTWGKEFNKAVNTLSERTGKKGQLLHYYINDKNVKYLCLYTSHLNSFGEVDYTSNILKTEGFKSAKNQEEAYELWDKVFYTKGIFENGIKPYKVSFVGITNEDLKAIDHSYLTPEDNHEGSIFNRFAEILRRHTISDKSNAYNKIFNLFLCKIVDEDNAVSDTYEMEFQWRYGEAPEDVIFRLSDLYRVGMEEYMDLDIADVSENEFDIELMKIASQTNGNTNKIKEMFKELRLYKNNEFAFKEVINKRTFQENAEIVKEVVKLLGVCRTKRL